MDEKRIEKLKEAIGEIEEEIGIEVFITVGEEEDVGCEGIAEKIERCERLRREYTVKIAELELESGEKNARCRKIRKDLSKEIEELCVTKRKLKNEEEICEKTERAAPRNERVAEERAGAIRIAAGANEETGRAAPENERIAEEKAGAIRIAAGANEETGRAAPENERVVEEKAGAIRIAAGANEETGRAAPENERVAEEKAGAIRIAAGANEKMKAEEEAAAKKAEEEAAAAKEKVREEAAAAAAKKKAEEVSDDEEELDKKDEEDSTLKIEDPREDADAEKSDEGKKKKVKEKRDEETKGGSDNDDSEENDDNENDEKEDDKGHRDDKTHDGSKDHDGNEKVYDSIKVRNGGNENDENNSSENEDVGEDKKSKNKKSLKKERAVKMAEKLLEEENCVDEDYVPSEGKWKGKVFEYNGPREKQNIIDFMKDQFKPPSEEKNHGLGITINIDRLETTVVGFFNGKSDMHDEYIVASNETRGTFKFMHTTDLAIAEQFKIPPEIVAVFQPEVNWTTYKEIMQLVKKFSILMVGHRSKKSLFKYAERPLVVIYYDVNYAHSYIKDTQFVRNKIVEIAKHFKDSNLRFAIRNEDEFKDEIKQLGPEDSGADVKVGCYTVKLHNETKMPRQFDPGINGDWSCSRLHLNSEVGSVGLVSNYVEVGNEIEKESAGMCMPSTIMYSSLEDIGDILRFKGSGGSPTHYVSSSTWATSKSTGGGATQDWTSIQQQRRTSVQLSGGSGRGVHGRGVQVEEAEEPQD